MIKTFEKAKKFLVCFCAIILLLIILIFLIFETINAKSIGTEIGKKAGSSVGSIVGSAKAVLNAEEFIEFGEDEGVLAKDSEIDEIRQTMQTTGKLRILSSDVSLDSLHAVGEKYKALYIMNGKVNFTIDLSMVNISYEDELKTLIVTIPEPKADLNIDSSTVKKLSESKNFSLVDSAEKGSKAYINSMNEIKKNTKKALENYDSLVTIAKNEAELRIKELVGSLSFVDEVLVKFTGGENDVKSK